MKAVEFTTDMSGAAALPIPREIAAQLPQSGRARVIVLTEEDDVPAAFHEALADYKAGRVVDLDTALRERPPKH